MQTPIITTKITDLGITYTHESETVTKVLRYLIRQFKPTEQEILSIHEINDLDDPGNEFAFLLQFNGNPDSNEDLTEEIPAYLADLDAYCEMDKSDYAAKASYDYTNNNQHFILLTICR